MKTDDESIHAPFDPVRDSLLSATQSDWEWLGAILADAAAVKHTADHAKGWSRMLAEVREGLDKPVPHKPLPVPGYKPQNDPAIQLVGANKLAEERILRMIDEYQTNPDIDRRWLAIARTAVEQGFMAMNRAIFQPERVKLPEDR